MQNLVFGVFFHRSYKRIFSMLLHFQMEEFGHGQHTNNCKTSQGQKEKKDLSLKSPQSHSSTA